MFSSNGSARDRACLPFKKKIPEIGAMPEIFGLSRRARLDSSYNMKLLEGILDLSANEEMFINSNKEDEINTIGAISMFMRRDHHRSEGFCENIIPMYSMDEFSSNFRMSKASAEVLCQEIGATGRVPQGNAFGRAPIPLQQQVLAFVWFISNSEVICTVSDRFDVTMSSVDKIIRRVSRACMDMTQ